MMRSMALCIAVTLASGSGCGGDDDGVSGDGGDLPADDAAPDEEDAAPGDDDAGPATDCDEYCERIAGICVTQMRQYIDVETCLATCALFPAGDPGDEIGNSLACRMVHVERAETDDPDPHCYHAGPSGGRGDGVCGAPCENYCMIVMAACSDEFASEEACMTACAEYPDPRPYTIFESRSDTVACRIFHATRATTDDNHCGTASPDSPTCTE